jgi:hypothetical protein
LFFFVFSASALTETTTRPGTINIKIPPGRRHDLSLSINRTNIDNYSARNINNDSDWSEMFGAVSIPAPPNQQENIPPNSQINPNDKTINENTDDAMLIDTIQYQLPSTENIAQHRQHCFQDPTTKTVRTGFYFY